MIDPGRSNFFYPASFTAAKPSSVRRIFVVGGSTVAGRPHATETSMTAWLSMRINQPGRTPAGVESYEVINVGGVSHAIHRLEPIIDECLGHQPDAIILYTGHNEFLEDRTYAHVRRSGPITRWITAAASRLATIRAIRRRTIPTAVPPPPPATDPDTRLDHADGMQRYVRDDDWRRNIHQAFEQTLRRVVDRVHSAGVRLVLCVPASDLVDTPPLKSTLRPGDEDLQPLVERMTSTGASDAQRQAAATTILARDPHHAGAHYLIGRSAWQTGDSTTARKHLTAARDHDVCPLRATSRIQQSVRDVASEFGIPLIETPELLSGGGRSMFADHVHPTIAGHQRIAAAIDAELIALRVVDGDFDSRDYAVAVTEHFRTLPESYFERGRQRLESLRRWTRSLPQAPFASQN